MHLLGVLQVNNLGLLLELGQLLCLCRCRVPKSVLNARLARRLQLGQLSCKTLAKDLLSGLVPLLMQMEHWLKKGNVQTNGFCTVMEASHQKK